MPESRRLRGVLLALALAPGAPEVFLKESFDDEGWRSRWVVPSRWAKTGELVGDIAQ